MIWEHKIHQLKKLSVDQIGTDYQILGTKSTVYRLSMSVGQYLLVRSVVDRQTIEQIWADDV